MSNRLQIDVLAPDFDMRDFQGREFHLATFQGEKKVVLVFNRGFV